MDEPGRASARELIVRSQSRGVLSLRSVRAIEKMQTQIDIALKGSYGIKKAGEILLLTIMPDDSGSMDGTNQKGVIKGHNDLLAAMRTSPVSKRAMMQTRLLNGRMVNPFRPFDRCIELNESNYLCVNPTPLFSQTIVTLGTVLAKEQELLDLGAKRIRTATLIMTDGMDTEDKSGGLAAEVASVVGDMRRVGDHIVAGMGFSRGAANYEHVFTSMGIDRELIFNATSRDEILDKFGLFEKAALALTAKNKPPRRVFEG